MKRNSTLLEEFETMLIHYDLTDSIINDINEDELKSLTKRLQLTETQVYTLVAFFANRFVGMTLNEIARQLNWSSVELLKNEVQINELVKRNYLRRELNYYKEMLYMVTAAAREAIRDNKPLNNVVKKQEARFRKMPLVERFEEVGNYLLSHDDDDSQEPLPEFDDMPEQICRQIASIKAELKWTEEEITVFAKVFKDGDSSLTDTLFKSYVDLNRFRSASDALRKRRLIYAHDKFGNILRIMPMALRQLENGEEMCFPLKFADNDKLFEGLHRQFKLRNPNNYGETGRAYIELVDDLRQIIADNLHLRFCNAMEAKDLEEMDMVTLVYMAHRLVTHNDDVVECGQLESIFDIEMSSAMQYIRNLRTGEAKLMELGLVEHSGSEFSTGENLCLTREARKSLLGDMKLVKADIVNAKDLKKPEKFAAKRMFYNEREREELARLTELLMPETFNVVKQRLLDCGERTGFVCLFYGAPGTGKTETVQQIARQTGRALYQVNISEINSKWVGESEKNIKRLFDRYRDFAEHCPVAPILFFNEADGVFTRRADTAASGNPVVTQMQNAVQNIVLQEMETLDGIMIATTNLTQNLDPAMERRILYKVKFDKPETAVKAALWQSSIPTLSDDEAKTLAIRYDFSGGQIENVKRKSLVDNILYGKSVDFYRINDYCTRELLAPARRPVGFVA